jgi:hypothetical protein
MVVMIALYTSHEVGSVKSEVGSDVGSQWVRTRILRRLCIDCGFEYIWECRRQSPVFSASAGCAVRDIGQMASADIDGLPQLKNAGCAVRDNDVVEMNYFRLIWISPDKEVNSSVTVTGSSLLFVPPN